MLWFALYLLLVITLPAVPGFCHFYFARQASLVISVFIGILTGQAFIMALVHWSGPTHL
jgi:hypothetical protein